MTKHFVTFYSPGTFVSETTTEPINSWDIKAAMALARSVKERYNAVPYGFQFSTRTRGENDLDSSVVKKSRMYYLGGKVETLAEIEARNDPAEKILLDNMRCNGYKKVLINTNSWHWTVPLRPTDRVLEFQIKEEKCQE